MSLCVWNNVLLVFISSSGCWSEMISSSFTVASGMAGALKPAAYRPSAGNPRLARVPPLPGRLGLPNIRSFGGASLERRASSSAGTHFLPLHPCPVGSLFFVLQIFFFNLVLEEACKCLTSILFVLLPSTIRCEIYFHARQN